MARDAAVGPSVEVSEDYIYIHILREVMFGSKYRHKSICLSK